MKGVEDGSKPYLYDFIEDFRDLSLIAYYMTSTNWLVLIPIDADERKFKSFEFFSAIFGVAYHRSRTLMPHVALVV